MGQYISVWYTPINYEKFIFIKYDSVNMRETQTYFLKNCEISLFLQIKSLTHR